MFIAWAGKSSLGMAYGLALAECLMAPAMPSCTARAGGIFMPVRPRMRMHVTSLCSTLLPSGQ
jgi:DASS family divalent anion:Na+ symporter